MFISQVEHPYTAVMKVTLTHDNLRDTSSNKQTTYNKGPAHGQALASPATPSGDPNQVRLMGTAIFWKEMGDPSACCQSCQT